MFSWIDLHHVKILKDIFSDKRGEHLCEDCKKRIKINPLRVLDCKNDGCRESVISWGDASAGSVKVADKVYWKWSKLRRIGDGVPKPGA